MNIHFEYHEVAGSPRMEAFTTEKLNKLENKFDFIISVNVYFKLEKSSNPDLGKICSVRLNIPGTTVFATSSNASFEASIAKVETDLRVQLQRLKDKIQSH